MGRFELEWVIDGEGVIASFCFATAQPTEASRLSACPPGVLELTVHEAAGQRPAGCLIALPLLSVCLGE